MPRAQRLPRHRPPKTVVIHCASLHVAADHITCCITCLPLLSLTTVGSGFGLLFFVITQDAKSDHFPLQLDLSCSISTPGADARSTPSQSSTRPRFKYVELQADSYQQCLIAELLMHLVPLTGAIDVDSIYTRPTAGLSRTLLCLKLTARYR